MLTETSFKNIVMVSHIFFFFSANTLPSTTTREENFLYKRVIYYGIQEHQPQEKKK
ncbi:unnamed protein product, partial [Brassica rapa subsp. narinosa]